MWCFLSFAFDGELLKKKHLFLLAEKNNLNWISKVIRRHLPKWFCQCNIYFYILHTSMLIYIKSSRFIDLTR